jgi:hypothetical protein
MTAVDPLGTLPMFGAPEPAARPAPKRSPLTAAPRWEKHRPKTRAQCDDCVLYLHQNNGNGPPPATARHKRVAGMFVRLLCDDHAQQQRERDKGITP